MTNVKEALEETTNGGSVYVLGCAENHKVKVGRTLSLTERLADIQRMSPVGLTLLWHTPGGAEIETRLHREFSFLRSHGEWFDFDGVDPVASIRSSLERWPIEVWDRPGPLTVPRSDLVWITARDWHGPPIGVVVAEEHMWRGGWTYEVRDATGRSETTYEFSPEELRPCGLTQAHVRPGCPWPESDRRDSCRPLVPGFGGDL